MTHPTKPVSDPNAGRRDASYLFPDDDLPALPTTALRALIEERLPQALDQPDGTDANADVKIDYAQDLIEQARDELLRRGESFSPAERARLPFLRWPPTPEEAASARRRAEAERAAYEHRIAVSDAHAQRLRADVVAAVLAGIEPPPSYDLTSLTITAGGPGLVRTLSGAEILAMVDAVEALTGARPHLGYCCSRPGVTIDTDPGPVGFSITLPVLPLPALWALVAEWMVDGRVWSTELWDSAPPAPLTHFHMSVDAFFPRPATFADFADVPAADDPPEVLDGIEEDLLDFLEADGAGPADHPLPLGGIAPRARPWTAPIRAAAAAVLAAAVALAALVTARRSGAAARSRPTPTEEPPSP